MGGQVDYKFTIQKTELIKLLERYKIMNSDEVFTSLSITQRRFLSTAIQKNLSFIIVGGYAVRFHSYLREAKDLDLLLQKTRKNANIIHKVLSELGACNIDQVINFAVNEWKRITWYDIDILTNLWGTSYKKLYDNCIKTKIDRLHVSLINKNDLIEIKKKALKDPGQEARKKIDIADLKALLGEDLNNIKHTEKEI